MIIYNLYIESINDMLIHVYVHNFKLLSTDLWHINICINDSYMNLLVLLLLLYMIIYHIWYDCVMFFYFLCLQLPAPILEVSAAPRRARSSLSAPCAPWASETSPSTRAKKSPFVERGAVAKSLVAVAVFNSDSYKIYCIWNKTIQLYNAIFCIKIITS